MRVGTKTFSSLCSTTGIPRPLLNTRIVLFSLSKITLISYMFLFLCLLSAALTRISSNNFYKPGFKGYFFLNHFFIFKVPYPHFLLQKLNTTNISILPVIQFYIEIRDNDGDLSVGLYNRCD